MSLVTNDVKRGIKQLRFIEDRFLNGTLDPAAVRRTLQDIIEDKSTLLVTTPSWYSSVDAQIEKVSAFLKLHGGQEGFRSSDIPAVPSFTPRTKTEVLLLTVMLPDKGRVKGVRRTFDAWWDFIVPPVRLTKWRWKELKSDSKHLRLARDEHKPGIRWVAFDPNTHQGKSPKQALEHLIVHGTTLANAEVLMAAALFPEWVESWDGNKSPYPNMSGYQFYWDTDWSHVPDVRRWVSGRKVVFSAYDADSADDGWSSPVVRGC